VGDRFKMTERLIRQDVLSTAVFGISILSGVVSSIYLAEHVERDYSPERVEEIDEEIQKIDETVVELLREDECHVSIYNYLRDSNSFPAHAQKIETELSSSYTTDLQDLQAERYTQINDLRYVSVDERIVFGIAGFGIVSMALNGLGKVLHRSQRN
jgi:hypothetical protein